MVATNPATAAAASPVSTRPVAVSALSGVVHQAGSVVAGGPYGVCVMGRWWALPGPTT